MAKEKIYKYPNPEKIQINESDLAHELSEYKEVVQNSASLGDILVIAPAWIPVFTAQFPDILGMSGSFLMGVYATSIFVGSVWWVYVSFTTLSQPVIYLLSALNWWAGAKLWLQKNQLNPRKRAEDIKKKSI